ncbi:MAG: hypothetical protein JSW05_04670 [Candidatus Thorarchaeota archaeon]|nr:MAG: hypothetical protein JSW05_04670 [Candidatus Thorarchaeota archaeon]
MSDYMLPKTLSVGTVTVEVSDYFILNHAEQDYREQANGQYLRVYSNVTER